MQSDSPNQEELIKLESYLNKIPQYMFLPSFAGVPKPEVFLNKFKSKTGNIIYWCHSGLADTISDWCKKNNIQITGIDDNLKYRNVPEALDEFIKYVDSWQMSITPRPYQYKAAYEILKNRQSLSQLAARAGKTLIAYIVFRYMLEHGAKKILMIVPSIQLVKQGVADFSEYAEFFKTETVWAKGEYCESANLTIGTFQSLVMRADPKSKKYNPKFFKDYDVICCDEAHKLVCKSINTILSQEFVKNLKLKFGFTGTLPEEGTIESFACHSLMGWTIQDISAMELVDEGFLAKPDITQIRIKYDESKPLTAAYIKCGEYLNSNDKVVDGKKIQLPKEQREFTMQYEKTLPYALEQMKQLYTDEEYKLYLIDLCKAKGSNLLMLEQMLVHRSKKRLKIIDDLLLTMDKNCIVFAHHTEYLKFLKEHFEAKFPDRKVRMISGSANLKQRQAIVQEMNAEDGVILCASYGCCSTGITFKNVDYCIFAQSFKSEIIVKQSIGRMMLKTSEKDTFYLYDLVDWFPTKRIYTQGLAKIKTYDKEGFTYRIINK
jgi:superfamily II DNA or RNA helicase